MLSEIQAELKAPKGQTNKFGGYKYRSCEDIVEAVKPILQKHNAYLLMSDEMIEVGGRVYVKATVSLVFSKDDVVSVSACARESEARKGMDDSQITGAASSYARKYALNGLFAIDDTKDADTMDGSTVHRFKPGEKDRIYSDVMKALEAGDEVGLKQVLDEYDSEEEKIKVWTIFNSTERSAIKELLK